MCMCMCVCVYVCMYVCMCMCVCVCVYIYMSFLERVAPGAPREALIDHVTLRPAAPKSEGTAFSFSTRLLHALLKESLLKC